MMRKPGAVLHMTAYGLIYGLLLAMLYIWGFIILMGTADFGNLGETLRAMIGLSYFAFLFGALPGGIMGFIEGWLLAFLARRIEPPLEQNMYQDTRNRSLAILGVLTFVGMSSLLSLLFALPFQNDVFGWMVFTIFPGLVAGGAAAYAVHRYMLKLRAWASVGKAKNEHKLKNQLADTDSQQDAISVSAEDEAQVNNLR